MKKPKPKKSADQLAKEAKEKEAEKTARWHNAARKQGEATKQHFATAIRLAMGCEFSEAEKIFEAAVAAGEVEKVRTNEAGDVGFYRMKK